LTEKQNKKIIFF